jgi:hypothetical protein
MLKMITSIPIIRGIINIINFYVDGFKNLKVGKKLWALIGLKLFIIFFILKTFLFPNVLKEDFTTDEQRSLHVMEQLTK